MSLTGTYFLAHKVRRKMLLDAANPNVNLRVIVTQANMFDNLVQHITTAGNAKLAATVDKGLSRGKMHNGDKNNVTIPKSSGPSDNIEVVAAGPKEKTAPKPRVEVFSGSVVDSKIKEYEMEDESDTSDYEDDDYDANTQSNEHFDYNHSNIASYIYPTLSPAVFRGEVPRNRYSYTVIEGEAKLNSDESDTDSDSESDSDYYYSSEEDEDLLHYTYDEVFSSPLDGTAGRNSNLHTILEEDPVLLEYERNSPIIV